MFGRPHQDLVVRGAVASPMPLLAPVTNATVPSSLFVILAIMTDAKPPFPPFDVASAIVKVQAAEDAWNTCDPQRVSLAYTEDSVWRNRGQFVTGRADIVSS